MNQLKFICPACNQHIEVEKAYSGHQMPCPTCRAEIRVPFENSATAIGLPRAELVLSPTGAAPAALSDPDAAAAKDVTVVANIDKKSAPAPITPATAAKPVAVPPPQPTSAAYCICPVCQSQLRVPTHSPTPGGPAPVAELVPKADAPLTEPAAEQKPAAIPPDKLSLDEREQQIAAARASHKVELYPSMKPRLSYILNGEKPGAPEPLPESAQTPPPPPKEDSSKTPIEPIKIFTE